MENIHKNILHLEPSRGLLNDPNGLVQFNGKYYVFHQWNRFGLDHSYKEWGLFTSSDLLHWHHEGSAILPDSMLDKDGIYSGSATVANDQLHVFFTGNSKQNGQRKSYQRQAVSNGNFKLIKKEKGLETPDEFTEHFCDPYIIKNNGEWQMLLGAQTKKYQGAIAIYTSPDLYSWDYRGIYFGNPILDQMCECPNLVDFGEEKVLLVCPQKRQIKPDKDNSSYSGYFIGRQNKYRFLPENRIQKLDQGFDFYAPQVFTDEKGRKIMFAWMSRMNESQEQQCLTREYGYIHCLTLPRKLVLKKGQLYQKPLEEYRNAAKLERHFREREHEFQMSTDFEIYEMEPADNDFKVELCNKNIIIEYKDGQPWLKRKDWSSNNYEQKKIKISAINNLSIYCDRSAIEIFINDGQIVMSARYFCF
ncbi:Sucrose-6-phosphate hydrolase [Lactobacillus helveticus]|uniref:glycoside hydrolase family 32 protein n=1 Tax=Lactobacillus helveticus TaxID=1587 RepID=UPI001565FD98|nr:glycoside hydrolase family 32 protein [Lactobacillus helveticus]NRO92004.1 Sucrose-6-phosphate hydrolase [Lactobacillus helveticus]